MTAPSAPARPPLPLVAALLLPIVALMLLVARAEYVVRSGRRWQVRITGYDPRDIVSGQFLRYRIAWDWEGGAEPRLASCPDGACALCLNRRPGDSAAIPEPRVRRAASSDVGGCDSFFPTEAEEKLHRYYIPEGMGGKLEEALRDRSRQVSLQLSISRAGKVAVTELLIDGAPWRERLKGDLPVPPR
jgi:hypothetical protein